MPRVSPDFCTTINVIYLPQLGCMVTAHDVKDVEAVSPDWEQQFSTDEVIYYKTPEMHRLDEHFGDLQNIIIGEDRSSDIDLTSDREIEWVQKLAERIDQVEESILAIGDTLAELDWCV